MIFPGTGQADKSVVPRVLLSTLFKNGCKVSLLSSHQELNLTAMTFKISWRVAWQLHQPVPSGLWDTSRQVP